MKARGGFHVPTLRVPANTGEAVHYYESHLYFENE
jgi:hypothetical protein